MKICTECRTPKPFTEFYGTPPTAKCKECTKAKANAYRAANLEKVKAYDRARSSLPHRVAARTEYQSTNAYSASHSAANARYRKRHPERDIARTALNNAVRDGRVVPWPICAMPECNSKPEAHHPDYSKPLDVVWLCDAHHKQAHAQTRKKQ